MGSHLTRRGKEEKAPFECLEDQEIVKKVMRCNHGSEEHWSAVDLEKAIVFATTRQLSFPLDISLLIISFLDLHPECRLLAYTREHLYRHLFQVRKSRGNLECHDLSWYAPGADSAVKVLMVGNERIGNMLSARWFLDGRANSSVDPTSEHFMVRCLDMPHGEVPVEVLNRSDEEFTAQREAMTLTADIFVLCFDLSSAIEHQIKHEIVRLIRITDNPYPPLIIVGLETSTSLLDDSIRATRQKVLRMADAFGVPYVEANLASGENVDLVFQLCFFENWYQRVVPARNRQ